MSNELQIKTCPEKITLIPFEHTTRYSETDQQGIIHHSNYMNWMEDARMNLLEQIGLGFKQMEEWEIQAPTLSISMEFHSPVRFNETVIIQSKLVSYDGHKMEIAYRIYDKKSGEERAVAKSTHCFVNKSGLPISLNRIYPELETTFFEFKEEK